MMSKVAKLLAELIAVPSVNPAFLPAKDPRAGEKQLGEFVATIAACAGLDVEFREVFPKRSNVLATLRPTGKVRQRVLLAPHLDTVGGADVPGKLFSPRVESGRLYGRGACDTKGSIAVMLSALIHLGKRPAHTEIVFAALIDEEYLQSGSRALAESGYRADLAIVGEPTRLKVVTAHKGAVWLHIETHGKAAHGARPELGRNAVYEMARIVDLLQGQKLNASHRLLGQPTISVGSIKGGSQPNIVPDHCIISVDRRTLPGESDGGVIADLERLFARHRLNASVTKIHSVPCPALDTSPQLPLVRQFMRAARQTQPAGVVFFSDAAVLASGDIPSVLFGPGDIAQAHTVDEWLELDQLDRGVEILNRFLQSLE
jgi:succinyl-diaminopimelate desuccinylase